MGGALWLAGGSDAAWLAYPLPERLIRLGVLVGLGVIAYFATLWVLGFRLNDFKRRAA
jgi:putative peptidoglycan lipid II flippase